MSVCSLCVKTTANSNEKHDKTIFLNLSDDYFDENDYNTQSIVESNDYKEEVINCDDISSNLDLLKIK